MNSWAWFASIWFGTFMFLFVWGLVSTVVRAKWGLSDRVTLQIRQAVVLGIDEWIGPHPEHEGDIAWRKDILPLNFDNLDDLSSQL